MLKTLLKTTYRLPAVVKTAIWAISLIICTPSKVHLPLETEVIGSRVLNVAIYGYFRPVVNPQASYNPYEFSVAACALESLVTLNQTGDVQGAIAESWKISEDKRTYTFRLNPSKGYDADHLISFFEKYISAESGAFHKNLLIRICDKIT